MAKAAKKVSNKVPAHAPVVEQPVATVMPIENPVAAQKAKPTVKQQNFQLAEFVVSEYTHRCEPSDTMEDIMRPEYWCHVAARTSALSRITVINRLKGWEASLRVLETGKGLLRVVLLTHTEWKMISEDSDEAARLRMLYDIEERPDGWRVKNSQGVSVSGGLVSKQAAEEFVTAAVKSLTTKAA